MVGIGYLDATGCIGFKFGEGLVDNDRHIVLKSRVQDVSVIVEGMKSDSSHGPPTATQDFTLKMPLSLIRVCPTHNKSAATTLRPSPVRKL
jgi:hypothetical protein